jgi:retinol dehydrogenase 14
MSDSRYSISTIEWVEMTNGMDGKIALVTGSTDGIGKQTALELAGMGAQVYLHARTCERGEQTLNELQTRVRGAHFELFVGDFASLSEVRHMAQSILSRTARLDVLVNNAGIMSTTRQISEDGYELTFAVNHLAHFLLTNLLLPIICTAPQGRVITVSSMLHARGTLAFDDLQLTRDWDGYKAYAQSKLANVLFAYELAHREKGITSNALHPGVVTTKLLKRGFGNVRGDDLHKGAATSVYLASSADVADTTGKYFQSGQVYQSSPQSHNRAWQTRLWTASAQMTGLA